MAYGSELILGYPLANWNKLTDINLPEYFVNSQLKLALPWKFLVNGRSENLNPDGDEENVESVFSEKLIVFNKSLAEVHTAALLELGFEPQNKVSNLKFPIFTTPEGEREFVPFALELFYDPDEMCEGAEDAVIGVAISGRYFPTFADWKDPSGGMPMIFDVELRSLMEVAKKYICDILPCLKDAPWMVKELHY